MACSIDGCKSKVLAKGMCSKHYQRVWAGNDPVLGKLGSVEDRFWRKVIKKSANECWPLRGKYKRYGQVWLADRKRPQGAHIYSYELHTAPVPPGMFVMHKCDNMRCVNPRHLTVGTPQANMDDMIAKGRRRVPPGTRGEDSPKAILTEANVRYIKAHPELTNSELGAKYGVVSNTINCIRKGKSWVHIK